MRHSRSAPLGVALAGVAALAVAPTAAAAQPACAGGTLASYVTLGTTGCVVGGAARVRFGGFDALFPALAEQVTLTPFARPLDATRSVVGFTLDSTGPLFAIGPDYTDSRLYTFSWLANPAVGAVVGARISDPVVAVGPRPNGGFGEAGGSLSYDGLQYGPRFGCASQAAPPASTSSRATCPRTGPTRVSTPRPACGSGGWGARRPCPASRRASWSPRRRWYRSPTRSRYWARGC